MNLLKSWTVPIEVVNEARKANQHWRIKSRRHRDQNFAVTHYLKEICDYRNQKIHVKLIRISPRMLDSEDNLPYAFKWIKDAISEIIYPEKTVVSTVVIEKAIHRNIELIRENKKPKRVVTKFSGRADDSDLIDWSYAQEKGNPKEKSMRVELYHVDSSNIDYISNE